MDQMIANRLDEGVILVLKKAGGLAFGVLTGERVSAKSIQY